MESKNLNATITEAGEWHIDSLLVKLASDVNIAPASKTKNKTPKTVVVEVTKQVKVTYESPRALRRAMSALKTDKAAEVHAFTGGAGNDFSYKPKNKQIKLKLVESK